MIEKQTPNIVFVGRVLREKGFFELMDGLRLLRKQGVNFRFIVCGGIDAGKRSSATAADVQNWTAAGLIDTMERVDDVRPYLEQADLVVLPSWREGTPRSLLEAMAVGRPIVATDVPGCREVVRDRVNGRLVTPRSSTSIAETLMELARRREPPRPLRNGVAEPTLGGA